MDARRRPREREHLLAAHGAQQIAITLSGTIDPSLHQSTTVDCSKGSVSFDQLLVQGLGTPYLEGTLLDAMGHSVAIAGVDVVPVLGTTKASLAFFAPSGSGGASSSSTSAASTSAASTTAATTSSASSSAASTSGGGSSSSTAAASSSTAAATSSSSGGAGGGDGGP